MTSDVFRDAETRMKKAEEAFQEDMSSIRTGRAHPSLIAGILVDYHGSRTPLNQLANISTPEARLLVVQPWDPQSVNLISKAIQNSDLGLNPSSDGHVLRVPVPPLTEDRRREMAKQVKQRVEQGKIAVRNIRRDELERIRAMEKNKEMSQDESRRAQERLQKLTDKHTEDIEKLGQAKEAEVMEV